MFEKCNTKVCQHGFSVTSNATGRACRPRSASTRLELHLATVLQGKSITNYHGLVGFFFLKKTKIVMFSFGVCCLFILDGTGTTAISQNCTYVQNPGFPSAYSDTAAISFTVNRCSNGNSWKRSCSSGLSPLISTISFCLFF